MKTTGIVRGIDRMGRVVIPNEIRRQLRMENDLDEFEIFMEGDKVILKKYQPACFFCGQLSDSVMLNGYNVCTDCIDKLNELKKTIEE